MPKYLGIDYGDKRIGVAISDEDGNFAFPRGVVKNDVGVVREYFSKILTEEKIMVIILGLPLNFSMKDTEQTKKVREFGEWLKKEFGAEVILENEILSTKEAEKGGGVSKNMIDASSAALILQGFLDRNKTMLK